MNFDKTAGAILAKCLVLEQILAASVDTRHPNYMKATEALGFLRGVALSLTSHRDGPPTRGKKTLP